MPKTPEGCCTEMRVAAIDAAYRMSSGGGDAAQRRERRLELLILRLPQPLQNAARWLRRPSSRWLRLPAGLLLIVGGIGSILPFLGLWMLPLGLVLLAEDLAPLRRLDNRLLDWIERHRPHWLTGRSG